MQAQEGTPSKAKPPASIKVVPYGKGSNAGLETEYDLCLSMRIQVFCHEQGYPVEVEEDSHDPVATHFLLRLENETETPIGTIRCYDSTSDDIDLPEARSEQGSPESRDGDKSISTIPCRAYHLGRLVVLPPFRKFGFGRDLVLALHDWAQTQATKDALDFVNVVLWSQVPAIPFYTRIGYQIEGKEFDYDGQPHIKMVYRIEKQL